MELGEKLKQARAAAGLTQEQVAEALLVTRQTISNWENGRTYPDIESVVRLSEVYALSLDELLKGDRKMVEHLRESTDIVKSNKKLLAAVGSNVLLLLCMLLLAVFLPDSAVAMAAAFTLAVRGLGFLLYQIIQCI